MTDQQPTGAQPAQPRRSKLLWQLPLLALLAAGTVIIITQNRDRPYRTASGEIFGTTYTATYQADSDMAHTIRQALEEVDRSLSTFNPSSTIAAINRGGDPQVDPLFKAVFTLALKVSGDTGGAFDITVAPLVNLWGFGFKSGQQPTDRAVDSLRSIVGYQRVSLTPDGRVSKADPRIELDCAAIAKGFGADRAALALKRGGAGNYMVEVGGEIVARGENAEGKPWRIGVAKPDDDPSQAQGTLQAVITIGDRAVATSGNYRNFYYRDGRKYAHTIDPKTGRPVQHSLLSATVTAPDCATADAYATAFMVMGEEKARQTLARHKELKALLITALPDGTLSTWASPGLDVE